MSSIALAPELIETVRAEAEAAYPRECCGLLVGAGDVGSGITVTRVVVSANVAEDGRNDRFEVDPMTRFETMRACDGTGEDIVGHYHSHPDHPAVPSATDLAMAFEPALAWLIAEVADGRVADVRAWRVACDGDGEPAGFEPLILA